MRGQIQEYRDKLGVGWIVGEDGARYRFHRDSLKTGQAVAVGQPVEFDVAGRAAERIAPLPPGTLVSISPPSPPTPAAARVPQQPAGGGAAAAARGGQRPAPRPAGQARSFQNDTLKRKRIKNYFRHESAFSALLGVLTGLALLAYGAAATMTPLGALIMAPIAALPFYKSIRVFVRKATTPTDQEITAWCAADIPDAVARALSVSSIMQTAMTPIEIRHAAGKALAGDASSYQRLGDDFEWRYSPQGMTVILLGDQQVCIYQCAVDFTTGVTINEHVYEFFYQEVVDIGWVHETQTIDYRRWGFLGRQVLRFTAAFMPGDKGRETRDMLRYVGRLEQQHGRYISDKVLQRNLYTTFYVTLGSGGKIHVPVFDGRPAAEAALGLGPDPNGARAMLEVARAFIREKKLILLGPSGARASSAPVI